MNVNGVSRNVVQPGTLTIAEGQECCVNVDAGVYGDSANGSATLYFEYDYAGSTIPGSVSTTDNNNLPNCHNVGQPKDDPTPPNDDLHMKKECGPIGTVSKSRPQVTQDAPAVESAEAPSEKAEAPVEEQPKAEAPKAETAPVEPKQEAQAEEPKAEEPSEPAVEPSEPATEG